MSAVWKSISPKLRENFALISDTSAVSGHARES
jgi:hypothetical protein